MQSASQNNERVTWQRFLVFVYKLTHFVIIILSLKVFKNFSMCSSLVATKLCSVVSRGLIKIHFQITYRNLTNWYKELRKYRPKIPVICVANKIDKDPEMAGKSFKFATSNNLEMFFASAADGSNVVKIFRESVSIYFSI